MFHRLKFDVTFPSTGLHLSQDLEFSAGFWAITGPNETGKSMIFEMLRYLMFGSIALRGTSEDYKTLTASGEFTIKGDHYAVTRTQRSATLRRNDEVVASGITSVNQKIVETLGFGIQVFDMACSINQGEVERLGTLTPTDRKRMVDGVLGLDALDVVGKWGMDEARLLDREADGIRARLVAPTPPTAPPCVVLPDLEQLTSDAHELSSLDGALSVVPTMPGMPVCDVVESASELENLAAARAGVRELVANLKALVGSLPTSAPYNEAQLNDAASEWERFDRYEAAKAWLAANPEPLHDAETCVSYLREYEQLDLSAQHLAKSTRLKAQIEEAKQGGACTVCDTPFQHDHITELEKELEDLDPVVVHFDPRTITRSALETAQRQWVTFDEAKHREMTAVEALDRPNIPREQIETLRARIGQVAEREKAMPKLLEAETTLAGMPDYEGMLADRRSYERAMAQYVEEAARYETAMVVRNAMLKRQTALAGARERLAEQTVIYHQVKAYEAALATFQAQSTAYDKDTARVVELEEQAAEHRKVRDLMNLLRTMIKQHLMPSLNAVSSNLLRLMTGGQRQLIEVDEDFNVKVDNQGLETLSGSGKACANLALRIALGQVLTNRVFSVLMADEIDAAMDEFRGGETSKVLCTLGNSICQILQVSHKTIESVNSIALGGIRERTYPSPTA